MIGKRGLSSDDARRIRQEGHDVEQLFALLIGIPAAYKGDGKQKKDLVDPSGDTHSIKSGKGKWQIFLYSKSRFANDDVFQALNGIGDLLVNCIDAFPEDGDLYLADKAKYKALLCPHMLEIAEKLQDIRKLKLFLSRSIFHAGQVDYMTILYDDQFHVFAADEITEMLSNKLEVTTSKKRSANQYDDQKVIFKYCGLNLMELEMRNDLPNHYREIRFNMITSRAIAAFIKEIPTVSAWSPEINLYGKAIKKFGRWQLSQP